MSTDIEKLKEIWNVAVENSTGEPDAYIGDDGTTEVEVKGSTIRFDADMDTAIWYSPSWGGASDLVYAKKVLRDGHNPPEVLESEEEFIDRVTSVVEEWNSERSI